MKVLAVLLLCAFAAVQGRSASTGVQNTNALAALGEAPWMLHLRVAVSTSGYLNSGAGSLISANWALTSATTVTNVRFIWVRYGAVNVINPELVTETSTVRVHPEANIAVVAINRAVESTPNIAPVSLIGGVMPASATLYIYGALDADVAGEALSSFSVALAPQEDGTIIATSEDGEATKFDLGAPLVNEGVQVGVLISAADDSSAGTFLATADYLEWIESETGLVLIPDAAQPEPEPETEPEAEVDALIVN